MLQIIKDGIILDNPKEDIRFENVNSIFLEDILVSDYSFPFTLPLTDTNIKAFGFAHITQVVKENREFDVVVNLLDKQVASKLYIINITPAGYHCSVATGFRSLINGEKQLRQLNLGPDIIIPNPVVSYPAYIDLSAYNTPNWQNKIAFPPHKNPNFYNGANSAWTQIINCQNPSTGKHMANEPGLPTWYSIVPFVYIHHILKSIFDENGFTITGNAWNNKEMSTLLLYNNYSLDRQDNLGYQGRVYKSSTPQGIADAGTVVSFNSSESGYDDPSGLWNNTGKYFDIATGGDGNYQITIDLYGYLPVDPARFIRVELWKQNGGTLTKLAEQTLGGVANPHFVINHTAALTSSDIVFVKAFRINSISGSIGAGYFEVKLVSDVVYNIYQNRVVLANHMPNLTVFDFLRMYKAFAQVEISVNISKREVSIDFIQETLSQPAVDITQYSNPFPEQEMPTQEGYTLFYDFGTQDQYAQNNFKTFNTANFLGEFTHSSYYPSASANSGKFIADLRFNKIYQSNGSSWVFYTDYHKPIVVGDGKKEYKVELAPMLMNMAQNITMPSTLMGHINEQGNSELFGVGLNNPCSLRVIFFRGGMDQGYTSLLASSSNYTGSGYKYFTITVTIVGGEYVLNYSDPVGDFDLCMNTTNSWYERKHKKLLEILDKSEVHEYIIKMPFQYLLYKSVVQINHVNYIIKQSSIPLGKFLKKCLVKLYKL